MKRKKTNPHRVPVSAGAREERDRQKAVVTAWTIMFTVLRDKEGFGVDGLRRVWDGVESLSEGIAKGYVNIGDLRRVLREEAGIALE